MLRLPCLAMLTQFNPAPSLHKTGCVLLEYNEKYFGLSHSILGLAESRETQARKEAVAEQNVV